jgi:glycosyltransferase involved in cell wall biosynthesis
MKIAQVAPLYERIPPKFYGGTERVVSYLTEELVRQGHEVTLFASGDSITNAKLVSPWGKSLRLGEGYKYAGVAHLLLLEEVFKRAKQFDIIHFHVDYLHFPMSRRNKIPSITTLHGRLDLPELEPVYKEYPEMPLVSISYDQRTPLSKVNWQDTVYHGLPEELYTFNANPENYLVFLGRIAPDKKLDLAIEIAKRAGLKLKIAAKIDPYDRKYFEREIRHLLNHPLIEFIGEVGEVEKNTLLGNAKALLFPIDWPEPFGLVMIEAMACGTPVIAFCRGSVPEVIDEGVTGFICSNVKEAVAAVEKIPSLSRKKCREVFEKKYSVEVMANNYLKLYKKLLNETKIIVN